MNPAALRIFITSYNYSCSCTWPEAIKKIHLSKNKERVAGTYLVHSMTRFRDASFFFFFFFPNQQYVLVDSEGNGGR